MTFEEFQKLDDWEKIRIITGIVPQTGDLKRDKAILTHRMYICCLIARVHLGDADQDFLDDCLKEMFPKPKETEECQTSTKLSN